MRILGLDPGLNKTGWGMIHVTGTQSAYVGGGRIMPPQRLSFPHRLAYLYQGLMEVIEHHRPDEAAVEETFVNQNPTSTLKLGMARGVVLTAPASAKLDVYSYGANKIKKSVVGAGHAAKEQVIHMVERLLCLSHAPSSDEADALATALCHAQHQNVRKLI